jgi:hypothetical protein
MKKLLVLLLMLMPFAASAAFTSFYVQTTADNLNAGSTANDAAVHSYAGGTFVRSTGIFTAASENPLTDGVAVGDFASIYTTSGATVATCIGRVTARDATTITISLTALAGATANVSETAAAATCKVGGAWKGPNAAVGFPFNFVTAALTDAAGDYPRVNFLGGTTYAITAAMTHSLAGPIVFEGYTNTIGDKGRATIDGGTSGSYYILLTISGADVSFLDFVFANNGGSSTVADGISIATGGEVLLKRVCVHDMRRSGVNSTTSVALDTCEIYNCMSGNSAGYGGFTAAASCFLDRCNIHHNTGGANSAGLVVSGASTMTRCISHYNGGKGFNLSATTAAYGVNCDAWGNTGDGFDFSGASSACLTLKNCNALKNGGIGFNSSGSAIRNGEMATMGVGSGTVTNTGGNFATAMGAMIIDGTVLYASGVTPWVDPTNANFSITVSSPAAWVGEGTFLQTTIGAPTNTVSYPSIGASSPTNSPSGGATAVTRGMSFAQ